MSDFEPSPASARRYIESDRVEGTAVYDARGHHVGEVKRLIIEKVSGQVAFVIIAFQSFFGIGEDAHAHGPQQGSIPGGRERARTRRHAGTVGILDGPDVRPSSGFVRPRQAM